MTGLLVSGGLPVSILPYRFYHHTVSTVSGKSITFVDLRRFDSCLENIFLAVAALKQVVCNSASVNSFSCNQGHMMTLNLYQLPRPA